LSTFCYSKFFLSDFLAVPFLVLCFFYTRLSLTAVFSLFFGSTSFSIFFSVSFVFSASFFGASSFLLVFFGASS